MVRLIRPALAASLSQKKTLQMRRYHTDKTDKKSFFPYTVSGGYTISTHSQERMNHMEELLKNSS